jgi:hypothetical protein
MVTFEKEATEEKKGRSGLISRIESAKLQLRTLADCS